MTGPWGNRLSICPLRFRIASPRVSIDRGAALETSHYLCTIGQAFSQKKKEKMVTIFGWFSAFIRRFVIHHCLITENKHFYGENDHCLH